MTVDHKQFAASLRRIRNELTTLNVAAEMIGADTRKSMINAVAAIEDVMISARIDKARSS